MENANDLKFRCSALSKIMTEARSKTEVLSQTTKSYLIEAFVSSKYKRFEEISSKYFEKGNDCEEASITLLSRNTKIFYAKNSERISNDFIIGEPDLYTGTEILSADEIIDTKTCWSALSFIRAMNSPMNDDYYWQGMGYMYLTGAKKHTIAYCLVNSTDKIIMDEKRKLAYVMNEFGVDEHTKSFLRKCRQIEINHIFDIKSFLQEYPHFQFDNVVSEWRWDIPSADRLFTQSFERNGDAILRIQNRVKHCRTWINENLYKTGT